MFSPLSSSKSIQKPNYPTKFSYDKWLTYLQAMLHYQVHHLNQSKLFAGLMIIILNIASKFVTVKLSKSMESYLKFTFSRDLLIFAIAWMGTRDIYIALIITCVFIFFMDYILNEDSFMCMLPNNFIQDHHEKIEKENNTLTQQDIQSIKNIASKIEKIYGVESTDTYYSDTSNTDESHANNTEIDDHNNAEDADKDDSYVPFSF